MEKAKDFLSPKELCAYLGISNSTRLKLEKTDKTFPKAIIFSQRIKRYCRKAVDAWLQARQASEAQPVAA